MFTEIIIFVGVPLIITIMLFFIQTSNKNIFIKIVIYFIRFISLSILLSIILLLFFPVYFGYIFDPFDTYRPNENTSPIPIVSFTELEKVAGLSEKYKIRFIEKTGTGYNFYAEYGIPLVGIVDVDISNILNQNNILYVNNYLDFYTTFEIIGSNRLFSLEKKGVGKAKKGDIIGLGKINRILNEKWILLDKCTRNNCPELDK